MELRAQLAALRARYYCGAVSPAIYNVIKQLETEFAWRIHGGCDRQQPPMNKEQQNG
jgi:hypothetical protein